MAELLRLPTADDPCLASVTRLQRLAYRLSQSPAAPSLSTAFLPIAPAGDLPTFAEMVAVVERRGRGRRRA